MSYCRFSSDDFKSDVYCYKCMFGDYITCVASTKIEGFARTDNPTSGWGINIANITQRKFIPIGLPYDGQEFSDKTLEEFKNRLIHLRECGYHVPDDALKRIDKEMKEEKDGTSSSL